MPLCFLGRKGTRWAARQLSSSNSPTSSAFPVHYQHPFSSDHDRTCLHKLAALRVLSYIRFDNDPQQSPTDIPFHRAQEPPSIHPTNPNTCQAGNQQYSSIRDRRPAHRSRLLPMVKLTSLGRKATKLCETISTILRPEENDTPHSANRLTNMSVSG